MLVGLCERKRSQGFIYDVFFSCRSCEQAGVAVVESTVLHCGPYKQSCTDSDANIVIPDENKHFKLLTVYPKPEKHKAPDSTPAKAALSYIEAKDNLQRQRYDTAVMLCRKVIDIATRHLLGEDLNKVSLSQRISLLHGKGLITEQMKDWAHIVRIDSNGAVHADETFTREEAEEMLGFTDVFLLYAFTLPAMVEAKKQSCQPSSRPLCR